MSYAESTQHSLLNSIRSIGGAPWVYTVLDISPLVVFYCIPRGIYSNSDLKDR